MVINGNKLKQNSNFNIEYGTVNLFTDFKKKLQNKYFVLIKSMPSPSPQKNCK